MDTSQVTFVGHPRISIGKAAECRSYAAALASLGYEPSLYDIYGQSGDDPWINCDGVRLHAADALGDGVRVWHINGDEVEPVFRHLSAQGQRPRDGYNIMVPAWELGRYPDVWKAAVDEFDEVWAISKFVQEIVADVTERPVIHMSQPTRRTPGAPISRADFGIREDAFVFFSFMDASSYLERKNPEGIFQLYRRLRSRNPYKRFVFALKIKERDGSGDEVEDEMLSTDPNFTLINRHLTEGEMTGLISLSDALVSLHRSEGFGRGVGEAMSLGLPVIATGYSGVLDMMTQANSWPLPYKLIPVREGEYPHHAGQVWADPDLDAAVAACEEVMDNPAERRRRVRRASLDLETNFSHAAVGLRLSERLSEIAAERTN